MVKIDPTIAVAAGVTVHRWWKSREIWNYLAGLFLAVNGLLAVVAPAALPYLSTLNLTPGQLLAWVVILNAVIYLTGIVAKFTSKSVIGNKAAVSEAKDAKAVLNDDTTGPLFNAPTDGSVTK